MTPAPRPADEADRLHALHALSLLDTPAEERFDRITRLVTALLQVPIALVSLVDAERQWFKSSIGLPETEIDRSASFCAHAILQRDVFVVEDATLDERFADNPLVTGPHHVRFYAGVPLVAPDGHCVGTICAIAPYPRSLSADEARLLSDLARVAEGELASVELSRATEELCASQARITGILSAAGDGIIGVDTSGYVTFANPAAAELLATTPEALVGLHLHDTHHRRTDGAPYPRNECPTTRTLTDGTPGRVTGETFERTDGTLFPVEYSSTPVTEAGQITGAVLVFQNVSARREMDRLKDEFVSIVSHELRTPLTSIRGSLGLLTSGALGQLEGRGQRMLEIAVESTDRLVRLVNDILDLERLRFGRSPFQLGPVTISNLMEAAALEVACTAHSAEVTIETATVDAEISGDRDRLLQVLTNLLGNATKFSPPGGLVTFSARVAGDEVVLQVSDQGRGIPPAQLSRIFEPFEQVDTSDARTKGGSGLGLAISKSIVEQHGGRIWVESELGAGSTFSVALAVGGPKAQGQR